MSEVPHEILKQYARGERTIYVSRDVFNAFAHTVVTLHRYVPHSPDPIECLAYRDARVYPLA